MTSTLKKLCGTAALLLILSVPRSPAQEHARPPYPASPVIAGISLDWKTHDRRAPGSDNWQLTWADDGHQYAPWGDGGGFGGTNSLGRVSLGVARIEGSWDSFQGVNVWGGYNSEHPATVTGKSWGIISIGGALYMWVSPGSPLQELQKEACLYVSRDHAATWQRAAWCFELAENLSVPSILQFSQDHRGAPDEFVYHYFIHPTSSLDFVAQRPGAIYLLRSPKHRLLDRSSYEFFAGVQRDGKPIWSGDGKAKRPVFQDANGVGWNLSVTWNPGLRRYLLITEHTASSKGNMGLFDAPEPWGPWTTIEYLNGSEGKQFGAGKVDADTFFWNIPLKWQSAGGLEFTLVFTGAGRVKGMTVGIAFEESSLHEIERSKIRLQRLRAVILGLVAIFMPSIRAEVPWPTASAEKHGFDKARLDALRDSLAATTKAFLVARDGVLIYEWYGEGAGPDQRHYTASLAKSLVGGMSLAIAMNDGLIRPDDPAWKYIPAWKNDPRKSKITIRHLASHSSGIQDAHVDGVAHAQLTGWMGAFWKRKPDPFSISLHQAPLIADPGTRYHYSNPGMAVLAYAVTASLKSAPHSDLRTLLDSRVFTPIGLKPSDWSIGYGESTDLDGMKLIANWGGGAFAPRATARVGQLLLAKGKWDGRQLIRPEWIREMIAYGGTPIPDRVNDIPRAASALGWHINMDGFWKDVPRDAFAGLGAGNQVLLVVPSLKLVMVRNGAQFASDGSLSDLLFRPLIQALASNAPPYPPSSAIRKITFALEPEIIRQAIGSDNWPVTWADDGELYTSYGDGWGFEPLIKAKLSLGLARVTGVPPDFKGINIRSESAERLGDGPKGPKASGMLMVDGVLYMWVRNTGNAQLVWSADRGRTWTWGFRFETSFGSPTFVNFGKNYDGARDQYVYTISQDGPSAYESDDGIILARVPKTAVRDQDKYEFFVRLGSDGAPVWTKNIEQRGPVFEYLGNCQRTDVVYNRGLRRYMMALSYGHSGGWGIYDAPEPWGPWTAAFHTKDWGLGGTHGYRLPSKWISSDGRTMHLIFSGVKLPSITYDAFCVRRMSIETAVER